MSEQLHESTDLMPSLDNAIRDYVSKRLKYEREQAEAEASKAEMEAAKFYLFDLMEAEDMKTISHGLGRVTRSIATIALIQDGEAYMRWLDEHGLRGAMTKIAFKGRETNALLKEKMEEGEDVPDGLEPFMRRGLTYTRSPEVREHGLAAVSTPEGQ